MTNNQLKQIYRVEFYNYKTGKTTANSIFFNNIEDAREYAEAIELIDTAAYICKY